MMKHTTEVEKQGHVPITACKTARKCSKTSATERTDL